MEKQTNKPTNKQTNKQKQTKRENNKGHNVEKEEERETAWEVVSLLCDRCTTTEPQTRLRLYLFIICMPTYLQCRMIPRAMYACNENRIHDRGNTSWL